VKRPTTPPRRGKGKGDKWPKGSVGKGVGVGSVGVPKGGGSSASTGGGSSASGVGVGSVGVATGGKGGGSSASGSGGSGNGVATGGKGGKGSASGSGGSGKVGKGVGVGSVGVAKGGKVSPIDRVAEALAARRIDRVASHETHCQRLVRTLQASRGAADPTTLFRGQMKRPWGGRVGHGTGYPCALSSAVAGRGSVGGTSAQLQLI